MLDFIVGSVWGWLSVTAIFVIGALAVALFIRPLRGYALMAAGVALAAGAFAAKVAAAATRRKQKEWDDAEKKSVERGNKALRDAKRDVDAGRVRDKFDRDDL